MAKSLTFFCMLCSALFFTCSAVTNPAAANAGNFTGFVCDPVRFSGMGMNVKAFGFCDKSKPYDVRAKDLVGRMTLAEKVAQLGDAAAGVPRLGLPRYSWWSEALHGVSNVGDSASITTFFDSVVPGATSFPTVILTAATFNESMWKAIGQTVSTEARAMHNLGHAGLTFWSPNINVVRDPRWGRILETPGEDPFVVGKYSINYVRGLQDVEGSNIDKNLAYRPLKVAACCKHYAAYDLDNWQGTTRFVFDAKVTEQDMLETFLRPFEMCVREGDAASVMCSYNRVNGIPTCADPRLLKDIIRGKWGLHGYVVSDCDSIKVLVEDQKFLNSTPQEGVARALKAGLDLDCGDYYPRFTQSAVQQGKVTEADIDTSLQYLYIMLMRLGFFDGSPEYQSLGKNDICSQQHIELATEAARHGIVLLKNDNQALPLDPISFKNLAVVGPHANATAVMIGNYAGVPCRYTPPLNGFATYAKVNLAPGCANVACADGSLVGPAVESAKTADATILVVGLDLSVEAEGLDRNNLVLPGFQQQLIEQVAAAAKGPVILVLMCAGGVDITFAKKNPKISAILWAGYPGEQGGQAIADVVFGKYNPGGKLPITWYEANYVNQLPMTSMQLRPDAGKGYPGRTYKFFNGPVVYPFGYGLSYTNFTYSLIFCDRTVGVNMNKFQHCRQVNYTAGTTAPRCPGAVISDIGCRNRFALSVEVQNTGKVDGTEVVLVYSKAPVGVASAPARQLVGFQRVFVPAGGKQKVDFVFDTCRSLGITDFNALNVLPFGEHTILVGDKISYPIQVNVVGNPLPVSGNMEDQASKIVKEDPYRLYLEP